MWPVSLWIGDKETMKSLQFLVLFILIGDSAERKVQS